MKTDWSEIECYRCHDGPLGPSPRGARYGAFRLKRHGIIINIIACDGEETDWEHVSVTVQEHRCPTWDEMGLVKSLFWDADECVIQFHPPEAEYVNNHRFCLHLWKPVNEPLPLPPSILVGITSPVDKRGSVR